MDPLSLQLACDCVGGYAQRQYGALARFLEKRLGRTVEIAYAEALSDQRLAGTKEIDLVIGKFSLVASDAKRSGLNVRTIAMLTGKDGEMTQTGLFVVRQGDSAKSVEDLKGRRILFGPAEEDEKHSAALAVLEAFDLPLPKKPPSRPGCNITAIAVIEKEADAGVVSGYAMPLLEGCGTIAKGELRLVGRTDHVPFVTVFATERVSPEAERDIVAALSAVRGEPDLLRAMESKDGFVPLPALADAAAWTDWRGPRRDAVSSSVPTKLPERKRLLWSRTLTGPGMSGLAVASGRVVVADKGIHDKRDVFRCLDADTGRELWKLTYRAVGEMDFTNSPRANPVIRGDLVYLLGAFGHLHCLKLDTGEVVWKRNMITDFRAELPQWGWSSTPLIVGRKLIVNPGAKDASIAALDRFTGKTLWATPGDPPGYASFILAELGGARQVIGYDVHSLGGWDPETGKRLWELVPEMEGDFNVGTPIVVGGKLLVSTENNGTRLYGFDADGRIKPKPEAANDDLSPDTSTPVVLDGMVFGNCGGLYCLDLDGGLKTVWESVDDPFADYCTFIAGNGRVLVMTQTGILCLVKATKKGLECASRLDLFGDVPDTDRDVWSHPALVGNRLYVRNLLGVYCFLIE